MGTHQNKIICTSVIMKFGGIILVLFAIFYTKSVQSIELVDSMEFRTALCSDCGMRFTGTVSLKLCGNIGCCYTPWLQGNFDEGNSDFFAGQSQLGECFDFAYMDSDKSFSIAMTMFHQGTDAGAFEYVKVMSPGGKVYHCDFPIQLIDNEDYLSTIECQEG